MKHRKLRIAWSVAWGVVCLLLSMLWVRSYSHLDTIGSPPNVVTSWRGRLLKGGSVKVVQISDRDELGSTELRSVLGVYVLSTQDNGNIAYVGGTSLPVAAILLVASFTTAVPWLRWRFSLRALLIAMTMIAVALGLAVWAGR